MLDHHGLIIKKKVLTFLPTNLEEKQTPNKKINRLIKKTKERKTLNNRMSIGCKFT